MLDDQPCIDQQNDSIIKSRPAHPEILLIHPEDGVFQAKLTGLTYNTSYHVRAYAVNGKGVGYSAYVIIKTRSSAKATIVNMTARNPSPSTLDVSATISADGGAEITERGFVYSSKGTPSVEECEKKIVMKGTVGEIGTAIRN